MPNRIPERPPRSAAAAQLRDWFGPDVSVVPEHDQETLSLATGRIAMVMSEMLLEAGVKANGVLAEAGSPPADHELLEPFILELETSRVNLSAARRSCGSDPLRVVLMGRTQAGKSTLLEALSAGDGARIGDGRQRYSRDVHERPCSLLPGITLVDTPGVGAKDGDDDFHLAFSQIPMAELVLWVASDDPIRESTARALRLLALMGKPIVVVINCRADLDHPARYADFLEDPSGVLGHKDVHVGIIERSRATAGAPPAHWVPVHADAAFRSKAGGPDARELWTASGIQAVVDALRYEQETWSQQRRLTRTADGLKLPAMETLRVLTTGRYTVDSVVGIQRELLADIRARISRVLDAEGELLAAELLEIVSRRRRWHTTADPKHFERAWREEVKRLEEEARAALNAADARITETVAAAARAVSLEWETLPDSAFRLTGLPGFESVWINRATRLAPAVAGAVVGFAVGGPIGSAIGLGIGVVGEVAAHFLKKLFKSEAQIIRERRDKVGRSLGKVLDAADRDLQHAGNALVDQHRQQVDEQLKERSLQLEALLEVGALWADTAGQVETLMRAADVVLAQCLLNETGRSRLAAGVRDAFRIPGVGIALALSQDRYTEGVLFPACDVVEPMLLAAESHMGSAAAALVGLSTLITDPLTVTSLSLTTLDVEYRDAVPEGVRQTWEDLLAGFSKSTVALRQGNQTVGFAR